MNCIVFIACVIFFFSASINAQTLSTNQANLSLLKNKGKLVTVQKLLSSRATIYRKGFGSKYYGQLLVSAPIEILSIPVPSGGYIKGFNIIDRDQLRIYYRVPTGDGNYKSTHLEFSFPESIFQIYKNNIDFLISNINKYQNGRISLEDGTAYLSLPGETSVIDLGENGGTFASTTPFPNKNGIIAAIRDNSGVNNQAFVGIDLATKKIVWEFPFSDSNASMPTQRLIWINERYLLATEYSRRFSSCAIIDTEQKKIVCRDGAEAGTVYMIINGSVFEYSNAESKKIF